MSPQAQLATLRAHGHRTRLRDGRIIVTPKTTTELLAVVRENRVEFVDHLKTAAMILSVIRRSGCDLKLERDGRVTILGTLPEGCDADAMTYSGAILDILEHELDAPASVGESRDR